VPPYYDSMVAKLIVHGPDRETCRARLARALDEFVVEGITTNIPLHRALIADPEFAAGAYHIRWLERWIERTG